MAAEKTKTLKRIRAGGIAGIMLAGLTLLQILLPVAGFSPATLVGLIMHSRAEASGRPLPEIGGASGMYLVLNLSVFCLVAALTVGVFKKSRWCAVLLATYCALAFIASIPSVIAMFGLPALILAVLLFFILRGMMASLDYRSHASKKATKPE